MGLDWRIMASFPLHRLIEWLQTVITEVVVVEPTDDITVSSGVHIQPLSGVLYLYYSHYFYYSRFQGSRGHKIIFINYIAKFFKIKQAV